MGWTVCRRCDNAGVIFRRKKKVTRERQPDGSFKDVVTEVEVQETCPACKGRGVVDQGGG